MKREVRMENRELKIKNRESRRDKTISRYLIVMAGFLVVLLTVFACQPKAEKVVQIAISRIAMMPDQPEPYKMTDWFEKAQHFDQYVFCWHPLWFSSRSYSRAWL